VEFGLPLDGPASVSVYDAAGRCVRPLAQGAFGAGRHQLVWDGRDGSGAAAASGVYFVRLRASGRDAVRRLAVTR
jgi:flagellar hook assembly protein FlgD